MLYIIQRKKCLHNMIYPRKYLWPDCSSYWLIKRSLSRLSLFVLGNNGFACSTSCPVTCNVGEMHCPGVQDPVTGN